MNANGSLNSFVFLLRLFRGQIFSVQKKHFVEQISIKFGELYLIKMNLVQTVL